MKQNIHEIPGHPGEDITQWSGFWTTQNGEPVSGFQLCPKCEGMGVVMDKYCDKTQPSKECPVCRGAMIINKQTGQPPQ